MIAYVQHVSRHEATEGERKLQAMASRNPALRMTVRIAAFNAAVGLMSPLYDDEYSPMVDVARQTRETLTDLTEAFEEFLVETWDV